VTASKLKTKRIYAPRIISDHIMVQEDFEQLHKFPLETERLSEVSDDMRELIEDEWPELMHKLPQKGPTRRWWELPFALAIGHRDRETTAIVIDCVKEAPPVKDFSPEDSVIDFAATLKRYGLRAVYGDNFGSAWVRERFAKNGVTYCRSRLNRSELYLHLLPLLHSGQIVLPNNARLLNQICTLERRTRAGGRDSIDHGPGPSAHDDLSNVAAGVAHLVANCGSPPGMGRWWDMTPAQQFIAGMKEWKVGATAKRPPANIANPQSQPCLIDFRKLERERRLSEGLTRKAVGPPKIW
jgi:hypothetical protein